MKEKIKSLIEKSLNDYLKVSKLSIELPEIAIEIPKLDKFGDYSSNLAIQLAGPLKAKPQNIAEDLVIYFKANDKKRSFLKFDVVPQGFVNFFAANSYLQNNLLEIIKMNRSYGSSKIGKGEKILLEYVSANPTGPLHIGHGRWAVIGSSLANIMKASGFKVDSEFYINDIGNQIDLLVKSIEARKENKAVPEGGYGGEYIKELADKLKSKPKRKSFKEIMASEDVIGEVFGVKIKVEDALKLVLDKQKKILKELRVHFDKWFKESSLHKDKKIAEAVNKLEGKKLIFTEKGAKWFRSTQFGDEKDRVLERESGVPTYFASDIAYHLDKFKRKYDHLINIWGTDHHGYVDRLKAAMEGLGYPKDKLEIIIGQLVMLYRGKEKVRMSKRTGGMITLSEVMDEIGVDATRYFLVRTSPNTHLNFDLELAKSKSQENPVYYVQYAHARICSILREAKKKRIKLNKKANLGLLNEPSERSLMVKLLRLTDEVAEAAMFRQPHKLTHYAEDLAATFHNFYHKCRVISDNAKLSQARLVLVDATRIVIRNVLQLLDIIAPESM